MKDSERAVDFLRNLYTRVPGGHAYEPDNYVWASQEMSSVISLIALLEEVRQDERKKLLT